MPPSSLALLGRLGASAPPRCFLLPGWREVSGEEFRRFATAGIDRLMHHSYFVETKGDSHRLAEALVGGGVIPLA